MNLASGGASWRVLCAPRSGFEGGSVADSYSVTARVRTRGIVDARPYGGIVASAAVSRHCTLLQHRGWRCSVRDGIGDGGDGRTGPMVTEVTGPADLASRRYHCTGAT
jgi:hypothetical protein